MRIATSTLVLFLVVVRPAGAAAEVVVQARAGRVDIIANNVPLAEVLGAVADRTGMTLRFDGAPPRALVTKSLRGYWPAEAVLELLSGQPLSYAIAGDASGHRIQTLIVTTARSIAKRE